MGHDVFRNPDGHGYLVVVQSDLLDTLTTRVVVPLLPREKAPRPADRLNPVFAIAGKEHVFATQFLAAVPISTLGESVGNLDAEHDAIIAALDMVFLGF